MIGNLLCLMLGGVVGMAAFALCSAAGDSDEWQDGYDAGYEDGERDGWRTTCMRLRTDCPAYERFIERGE